MDYTILPIPKNQIEKIEPLWKKLNEIHLHESPYFKNHFKSFTFLQRIEKFHNVAEKDIYIEIVKNGNKICGYCITTKINEVGELDSLFVSEEDRGHGLGKLLGTNSINWMKMKKCKRIQVSVSYGHESIYGFYQKLGLYPRLTYLHMRDV
jgi:diamine N-acetyltransferase